MNADFILLYEQFQSLRNHYMRQLGDLKKKDVWYEKYLLWKFERDRLLGYVLSANSTQLPSPEIEKLEHRRFQLQVLMDVAYIQGDLEQRGVLRMTSPQDYEIAQNVFQKSDGSEETMIPLIDQYF